MPQLPLSRRRLPGLTLILALLVSVFLNTGCSRDGELKQNSKLLTTNDVLNTLARSGIYLQRGHELNPMEFSLGDTVPTLWKAPRLDNEDVLIYVFGSIGARNEAWSELDRQPQWLDKNVVALVYQAKNVLIVYMLRDQPMSLNKFTDLNRLKRTVYDRLNESRALTFSGRGKHWDGRAVVNYYENFFDVGDKLEYDGSTRGRITLTYKGPAGEISGPLKYEFRYRNGGGSGTMTDAAGRRVLYITHSGTQREDDIYSIRIWWNGREEHLELKSDAGDFKPLLQLNDNRFMRTAVKGY